MGVKWCLKRIHPARYKQYITLCDKQSLARFVILEDRILKTVHDCHAQDLSYLSRAFEGLKGWSDIRIIYNSVYV